MITTQRHWSQLEQLAYAAAPRIVKAFLAAARLRHTPVELVAVSTEDEPVYGRWRVATKAITLDTSGFIVVERAAENGGRDLQVLLDRRSWPWFIKLTLGGR